MNRDTGTRCLPGRRRETVTFLSGGAAAVISDQTSTEHSLDILRATLTLLQGGVSARSRLEVEDPALSDGRGWTSELRPEKHS